MDTVLDEKADASVFSSQTSTLSLGDQAIRTPIDEQKVEDIRNACKIKDIKRLAELADSKGGFLTDALREEACKYYSHGNSVSLLTL